MELKAFSREIIQYRGNLFKRTTNGSAALAHSAKSDGKKIFRTFFTSRFEGGFLPGRAEEMYVIADREENREKRLLLPPSLGLVFPMSFLPSHPPPSLNPPVFFSIAEAGRTTLEIALGYISWYGFGSRNIIKGLGGSKISRSGGI